MNFSVSCKFPFLQTFDVDGIKVLFSLIFNEILLFV